MTVHVSDYTTSQRFVLTFRRGRIDVEVEYEAATGVVADRAVAVARGIDARIIAAGGGLP